MNIPKKGEAGSKVGSTSQKGKRKAEGKREQKRRSRGLIEMEKTWPILSCSWVILKEKRRLTHAKRKKRERRGQKLGEMGGEHSKGLVSISLFGGSIPLRESVAHKEKKKFRRKIKVPNGNSILERYRFREGGKLKKKEHWERENIQRPVLGEI